MKSREQIATYTNHYMEPLAPKEGDIYIEDIAHALSLMTRANGHFHTFFSVGQHCLNCQKEAAAREFPSRLQLALLLHDASEAYISDLTRPVKSGFPQYRQAEDVLQAVIYHRFGLWPLGEEEIRAIDAVDTAMLYYEFEHLHPGGSLGVPYKVTESWDLSFRIMTEVESEYKEIFLQLFEK